MDTVEVVIIGGDVMGSSSGFTLVRRRGGRVILLLIPFHGSRKPGFPGSRNACAAAAGAERRAPGVARRGGPGAEAPS